MSYGFQILGAGFAKLGVPGKLLADACGIAAHGHFLELLCPGESKPLAASVGELHLLRIFSRQLTRHTEMMLYANLSHQSQGALVVCQRGGPVLLVRSTPLPIAL